VATTIREPTHVLDSTSDAPGGNDAGAQTGVVLELARVLAGNLTRYFQSPQVIAMLNTDIPGGDTAANTPATLQNFRLYSSGIPRERLSTDPDGTTDNTSANRGVMRYVGTWGGTYVPALSMEPELREDRPGRASDPVSFINNGIPAVRFMETFECSPLLSTTVAVDRSLARRPPKSRLIAKTHRSLPHTSIRRTIWFKTSRLHTLPVSRRS